MRRVVILCLLLTLLLPCFSLFADSEPSREYDSFTAREEHRTRVSYFDLITQMKIQYPELDNGSEYEVLYDAIIVEWRMKGSFWKKLPDGEIELSSHTVYDTPILHVPIMTKDGGCVAYATVTTDTEKPLSFYRYDGEIITESSLDAILGVGASGFTLISLSEGLTDQSYVLAHGEICRFYRFSTISSIGEDKKGSTAEELAEDDQARRKAGTKLFFAYLMPGLLGLLVIYVILPLCGIGLILFLIWLVIFLLVRRKKKRADTDKQTE